MDHVPHKPFPGPQNTCRFVGQNLTADKKYIVPELKLKHTNVKTLATAETKDFNSPT